MLTNLMPKIMAFIAIVVTVLLSPLIYTANLGVVNFVGASSMMGLTSISAFGGFLIIFGLMISQGIFAFQLKGQGTRRDMFWSVGTVIGVIILLNVFVAAILPAFVTLIAAAVAASDTIGTSLFGMIPLIIYMGIVVGASGGVEVVRRIVNKRKGKGKSARKSSAGATAYT